MNGRGVQGTRGQVIQMLERNGPHHGRPRASGVAISGFISLMALLGCGGARDSLQSARTKGLTTVEIVNQVSEPCELSSIVIAIDGNVVRLSPAPPRGDDAFVAASVVLEPGDHQAGARVSARCAAAETLVVSRQQTLRMNEGPAVLTIAVGSQLKGASVGEKISVHLAARGALLTPEGGVSDHVERCAGLGLARKALCMAEADFALATAQNNVIWALCVRDKLGELRQAADLDGTIRQRADRQAEALAESRVSEIASRVERCAQSAVTEPGSQLKGWKVEAGSWR